MSFEIVLQKAFRSVPAREANAAISAVRQEHGIGGDEAMSYEVVAEPQWKVEELAERVLPKLVYFLDCRGMRFPLAPGGVFVSLFVGEALHFIHAGDFVEALAGVRGVALSELADRWGADALAERDGENERAPADGSGAREVKLLPKA